MTEKFLRAAPLGAAMLAFMLVVPSCSDSGASSVPAAEDLSDIELALVDSMIADEDFPATDEEARCAALGVTDAIGEDRLIELGVESDVDTALDGFNSEEATKVFDAVDSCVDIEALMADSMVADGVDRDGAECFVNSVDLRALMRTGVEGDPSTTSEIFTAMEECGIEF